ESQSAPQGGRGRGAGGRAAANSGVTVTPMNGTNSLLLNGPGKDLDRVEAMITKLDTEDVELIIENYPVKGEPSEYESLLNAMFAAPSGGGGRGQGNASTGLG